MTTPEAITPLATTQATFGASSIPVARTSSALRQMNGEHYTWTIRLVSSERPAPGGASTDTALASSRLISGVGSASAKLILCGAPFDTIVRVGSPGLVISPDKPGLPRRQLIVPRLPGTVEHVDVPKPRAHLDQNCVRRVLPGLETGIGHAGEWARLGTQPVRTPRRRRRPPPRPVRPPLPPRPDPAGRRPFRQRR